MRLLLISILSILSLQAATVTTTKCVNGYLFVIATNVETSAIAITQIFAKPHYIANPAQPIKCEGNK